MRQDRVVVIEDRDVATSGRGEALVGGAERPGRSTSIRRTRSGGQSGCAVAMRRTSSRASSRGPDSRSRTNLEVAIRLRRQARGAPLQDAATVSPGCGSPPRKGRPARGIQREVRGLQTGSGENRRQRRCRLGLVEVGRRLGRRRVDAGSRQAPPPVLRVHRPGPAGRRWRSARPRRHRPAPQGPLTQQPGTALPSRFAPQRGDSGEVTG